MCTSNGAGTARRLLDTESTWSAAGQGANVSALAMIAFYNNASAAGTPVISGNSATRSY